jgi:hypothetical protein
MEELQSDVMRFMAILAFCLVAVFALVQGVPLGARPEPRVGSAPPANPTPEPRARVTERAATPSPAVSPRPRYSLRFATNVALLDLAAADTVGLYALVDGRTWRLRARGKGLSFYPTLRPAQLHLMAAETVPAEISRALRQTATLSVARPPTWGVTLPETTRTAVSSLMRSRPGGVLVISGDASVGWEDADAPAERGGAS